MLVATFVACAPALWNGFAYDGSWLVRVDGNPGGGHPLVRELHAPWVYWNHEFHDGAGTPAGLFRPATVLSWAVTRAALGPLAGEAFAQHLVNLLLHLAVTGLVFGLLRRLRASPVGAALGALVYGVHAIHSEVVAGTVSRHELLGAALGLVATLLLAPTAARSLSDRSVGPARRQLALAALAFFLAFSSKESALPFAPFAAFALLAFASADAHSAGRSARGSRSDVAAALRRVALTAGPALVAYLVLRARVLAALTEPPEPFLVLNPTAAADTVTRVATATEVWGRGLLHLLAPYPLCCNYGAHVLPLRDSLLAPGVLASALTLLGIAVGSVLSLRRAPMLALAGIVFLGFSFVTSNVAFPLAVLYAERFHYTPSVAVALLVAWLVDRVPRRQPVTALVIAYAAVNAVLLVARIPDWHDSARLFRTDVATHPQSANLHGLNARIAADERRYEDAVRELRQAVEIEPRYATAWADLGAIQLHLGHTDEAERALRTAIDAPWQQQRDRPAALMTLALLERDRGAVDAAAACLRRAVTELPSFFPAWERLRELVDDAYRRGGRPAARAMIAGLVPAAAPEPVRPWLASLLRD
ncbi:MAG: tetratricopeptide repeat protein [Planctomycetes bacterium]|nr:tetratricopeptide repeat protein [Planctomycetota bacterium]